MSKASVYVGIDVPKPSWMWRCVPAAKPGAFPHDLGGSPPRGPASKLWSPLVVLEATGGLRCPLGERWPREAFPWLS